MSWSLFPIEGSGLHLSINEGWDVKMRCSVLSLRVGKLTICSSPLSDVMSKKLWLTRSGYWLASTNSIVQLISGKLKSPPRRKIFLFLFSLKRAISSLVLERYVSSVLLGGM